MKKRVASSMQVTEGKPVHVAALDSPLFKDYPNLMKHLAVTRFDDGTARLGGTLIFRVESANWKIIIKEPSSALQLIVSASTFDDALALAELLLGADEAPWDEDPNAWQPKKSAKKKD